MLEGTLAKKTSVYDHFHMFYGTDVSSVERSVKQAIEKAKTPQITFDACAK